jgi:antitoxin (DNA-binding transcriptional repressor) of toxin-antitoxin stability system
MTTTIDIETTQLQLSDLVALVRTGGEVIVQEDETPVLHISKPIIPVRKKPFIFGLSQTKNQHSETTFWMSEDFDDELPMSFWLGEDA